MVDGELEPLEAAAIHQHLKQQPDLAREVEDIERLKLSLHMAGTREAPPPGLETRLRAQLETMLQARREATARRGVARWLVGAGAMGALAIGLVVAVGSVPTPSPASPQTAENSPLQVLQRTLDARLGQRAGIGGPWDGRAVVETLVDAHLGDLPEAAITELRERSLVRVWDRVPAGFVEPEGREAQLVLVSTMSCAERPGATLVVLEANRVNLPQRIEDALETTGVFSERVDGVRVRYSRNGDSLYLVLQGDDRFSELDPI